MFKIGNVVVFFILFQSIFSLKTYAANIDSLLFVAQKASGVEKLETIYTIAILHHQYTAGDLLNTAKWLEKEAKDQKDMLYLSRSYQLKTKHFVDVNNVDSVLYYADKIRELVDNYGIEGGSGLVNVVLVYLNNGYHDLVIHNIKTLLDKNPKIENSTICALLGYAYLKNEQYDLARESLRKALDIEDVDKENPLGKMTVFEAYAASLLKLDRDEEVLVICKEIEKVLASSLADMTKGTYNTGIYRLYKMYVGVYAKMEDAKKARLYLNKMERIPTHEIPAIYRVELANAKHIYYYLVKDYDKASVYLDDVFEQLEGLGANRLFLQI